LQTRKLEGAREGLPWCDPVLPKGITCKTGGELEDLPPLNNPTPVYFLTFTESVFKGSTEWENRIAVTHTPPPQGAAEADNIVVSFIATPNIDDGKGLGLFSSNQGIWTVRANLFLASSIPFAHVYRPVPVVQLGDSLGPGGSTITGLAVYDPLIGMASSQETVITC
jgi:hypothetical protein